MAKLPDYHYIAQRAKKDASRVLCGYRTCEGELAFVMESSMARDPRPMLYMVVGWRRREDGIWCPPKKTDHSKYRPGGPGVATFYARTDSRFHPTRGLVHPDLPAVALCPVCGHANLLSAESLGVRPWSLDLPLTGE